MNYANQIQSIEKLSFKAIRRVAIDEILPLPNDEKDKLWFDLKRGTALLNTHKQMCQYMFSYGKMHQAKLLDAFKRLDSSIFENEIEVIDWGCGQAMGTINLFDHLLQNNKQSSIRKVTLIEPSEQALERARIHVEVYCEEDVEVITNSNFFENIQPNDIASNSGRHVIHIFSNIIDVAQIDLKHLSELIDSSVKSDNYLICVGPLNPNNTRIDHFFQFFNADLIENLYTFQESNFQYSVNSKPCTYKARIYKLEQNKEGHLIPIEYYPPVQFHSAYALDAVKAYSKESKENIFGRLLNFEVAAPYDLGASVYNDVHPILAVLNNIITRGLPTSSSLFVERAFQEAFGLTKEEIYLGTIKYTKINSSKFLTDDLLEKYYDKNAVFEEEDIILLQFLLTPIAIARFQKVLIEAIITGHVSIDKPQWEILVKEKDVPFAALAILDLEQMFNNLCKLSSEYSNLSFPKIKLDVISHRDFVSSPLHVFGNVVSKQKSEFINKEYDFVYTQATLSSVSEDIEKFSPFKAKNNSYFNCYTSNVKRKNRTIYTSQLVKYKNIVDKNPQGQYIEDEENKAHLTYFLQLLFRKKSFRAGQLPILDRALKNQAVIGLLPTGGGKSLTYQIAAMLQPGITMIIDPLKSLMKDQYDGLIENGVDTAAYINSTLNAKQKKEIERKLESSELQFIFLSPERLSIASFRERLKNMHDYNVYFSYGVIDEVHCVSEWGHDFRFSYLHLGRNLYNYVRAKNNEISLFGLTATASFDVLADVERELSGNGAFDLDADVIVRYENTNRLELQYNIEPVPVKFEEDQYFDRNGNLPAELPKALNIKNHWPLYDSKSAYLKSYLKTIPRQLRRLQRKDAKDLIKSQFIERQNSKEGTDLNLNTSISENPYEKRNEYSEAGIIFCPHVNSTGLSVNKNSSVLRNKLVPDVASFSGKDNDDDAMRSLELFRDNKSPLMVATKAFGMGIDKPNVRFTVNMNYSSSLEAFVQEAGRSGRDRKIAMATILVSDYKLAQISRSYGNNQFPLGMLKNKWFHEEDLKNILTHYNLSVPDEFIVVATPDKDIVKLHCSKDNKMFAFNKCNETCTEFKRCQLRKVSPQSKIWMTEKELIEDLKAQGLPPDRKNFNYLNADYQSMMFFFNNSFKGDFIEKTYMNNLLNKNTMYIGVGKNKHDLIEKEGFLSTILKSDIDEKIIVFIPYVEDDYSDLSKAIYRMTCIELIEDFTQDYINKRFRIVTRNKKNGDYYKGLKRFLLRYYTSDRAEIELDKVKRYPISDKVINETAIEIYRCLAYLTEFVYDKISEKRKRALDDMRNFCMEGLDKSITWLERNEKLKDFIYYYFNSKYAKDDYVTENGEEFSLVEDTDGGKESTANILYKYLRVIDDDVVGVGTPLDNVKHLYGAVRLIGRSLTDSNPALYLLEVFCLAYMGTKNNKSLEDQLVLKYSEGLVEFANRLDSSLDFWELFENFNSILSNYLRSQDIKTLKEETTLLLHVNKFKQIKQKYLA